jgi:hypothetical protein
VLVVLPIIVEIVGSPSVIGFSPIVGGFPIVVHLRLQYHLLPVVDTSNPCCGQAQLVNKRKVH